MILVPNEEENFKIRSVRLQNKISKLRNKAHRFKTLFQYVSKVNDQLREENLQLYVQNDELRRKDQRLKSWKTSKFQFAKKTSARGLATQLTKCLASFRRSLENLAQEIDF